MRVPRSTSRLGALRHRISIEEPVRTPDEGGGAEITWNQVAAVWAEITPKSGREVFESDQLGGRITHEVRLRYRQGIIAKMRLTYQGRIFDIRHVASPSERREWLICACEEQTQ